MGVFIKRPLCSFCFCFIFAALVARALPSPIKLALTAAFLLLAALFFAFCYKSKRKYGLIQAAISLTFAACAVFSSLAFIDVPDSRLDRFEGEGVAVDFVVLKEEHSSRYSSIYEGKIIAVDGKDMSRRARLVLDEEADFIAGERILLVGNVSVIEDEGLGLFNFPADTSLEISPTIQKELFVVTEYDGFDISVICSRLRQHTKRMLLGRLDKDSAALSLGVLTGDTSMIERGTVRDFRRAGLSHILAVSGLHLSVILGAAQALLRALGVSKGKRCAVVVLLSFFLLMLSGFSPSACRAVLMLLCAYLCYMLSREPDVLTSLSVAGMLILFVSPRSVGSLSFWLSFLATLGIVLYSELLRDRRKRAKPLKNNLGMRLVKRVFGALAVTLSANVFICVVSWICFGELSVISPLSNLLIAPLSEVYLILTVIVFVLGGSPLLDGLLSYAASLLSTLIIKLAAYFSALDFSVVSLRYAFAGIIICLCTVLLAVLFIVKLRKRFIIALLPVLSALAFCVCLGVHNFIDSSVSVAYVNQEGSDSLALADRTKCVIIDVSDGSSAPFYISYGWARAEAFVEIEALVLTHYHARHISSLDRLLDEAMVRRICIPAPTSSQELDIMKDVISLAVDSGVGVKIYDDEEVFGVCDGVNMFKLPDGEREDTAKKIISFSVATREGVLTYADSSWHNADTAGSTAHFIAVSDVLVLGAHGPRGKMDNGFADVEYPPLVVGTDIDLLARTPHLSESSSELMITGGEDKIKICEFEIGGE